MGTRFITIKTAAPRPAMCTLARRLVSLIARLPQRAVVSVFDGNDGMSGLKFSNWEGGTRLPFMVRWPVRSPLARPLNA